MKRGYGEKIESKQKKIKLEGQPKRAQSAFFIWMNSNRDQIRKESPSNNGPDMAKTAGELWKTMSKSVSLHLYTITRGYLMSGSCHLDRALNDEFSVDCLF